MDILALILAVIALIIAILAYQKVGGVTELKRQIEQIASSNEFKKSADSLAAATEALREKTAEAIGKLVGENLLLAILVVTWLSAILSMVVANIPFTAAMLPVVGFLTTTLPGAESKVLFFCLSVGSAMGGNGSLIGASANMITSGIAERAGFPITYAYFFKKGFPALVITVGLATVWLIIRFL